MKRNSMRRIILFLSICVSVFAACFCVLQIADKYYTARNKLNMYNNEYQGWEAFRQTESAYFEVNEEAINSCRKNLEEAKDNFWVKLPRRGVIGWFVLSGLGSAISGYLVVWAIWFVCLGIYKFVQTIKHFFQKIKFFLIGHQDKEYDINKEVEELEYNLSTAKDEKEGIIIDLEHQIEMMKNEICSMRAHIEKLSTIENTKRSASRDEHIDELYMKDIKQKGINFY